jgi:hypothetical protein
MPNEPKTIVISDIHMSNGEDYSWFKPPNAVKLAGMLNAVADEQDPFTEVDELVLLGDVFDCWLYPVNDIPWTVERIVETNPDIKTALGRCVETIPHVYYLNGNHDMDVTQNDLGFLSAGTGQIQKIDTAGYRNLHPNRHIEHGHVADMFNAPDTSPDSLGGYPLGYYITRLVATGHDQNEAYKKLRELCVKLYDTFYTRRWVAGPPEAVGAPETVGPEELAMPQIGSLPIKLIVGLLKRFAQVEDDTEIKVSPDILQQRFGGIPPTVGDITRKYGDLFYKWYQRYGLRDLLKAMLATESLNWHAKEILENDSQLKVVVMGHTHAWVSDSPYDNDGCWCDSSVFGHAQAAPTYVDIVGDNAVPKVWP